MARASGSPLILVILVITSFRLQVQVLGKLDHTSHHARGHSWNLARHLLGTYQPLCPWKDPAPSDKREVKGEEKTGLVLGELKSGSRSA